MPTFLFNEIVFGPVKSRRLGVSLGINLLPNDSKYCNYNCVYCECGWSNNNANPSLPTASQVLLKLEEKLVEMKGDGSLPDVITYAGNGEPTMHPQFFEIMQGTKLLRDKICPDCEITVLTNATLLKHQNVVNALYLADKAFMKLDSAIPDTIQRINKPVVPVNVDELCMMMKNFGNKLIIQTMFVRGVINGVPFDNTRDSELEALLGFYEKAQPSVIHIYSIARDTPLDTISVVSRTELDRIAKQIENKGLKVNVY
mgnify:CR=1 FL=1